MRVPASIVRGDIPRLQRLDSSRAQEMLCSGEAFVARADAFIPARLQRWDFKFLERHLPSDQKFGVMLDADGSGKIVMSHTARNGMRQVDRDGTQGKEESADQYFSPSDQSRMTFGEFLKDVEGYRSRGRTGKLPYFGIHLLWRFKEGDNGYLGNIDEDMADDLWSIDFEKIKEWQTANLLPLVQRFYLFCGIGGTLYHCHYDLQPNLHVQLTGRKRFVLWPPDDWVHLYPFPVHHDLDRRSMVDFDAPDSAKFPKWKGAHAIVVELNPGDALYIPPYWWHQVQSLSQETTSMAMWFFERFPLCAGKYYGIDHANGLLLMRELEEAIGREFPDEPGEEDASKSRPVKASQVANFMQWLKPRVGLAEAPVDRTLLGKLKRRPEDIEKTCLDYIMLQEEAAKNEEAARKVLKRYLEVRF